MLRPFETPQRTYVEYGGRFGTKPYADGRRNHRSVKRTLPSSCVVLHPTLHFFPPPPLTQSFSQCHSSLPPSSFRLLSTFFRPPWRLHHQPLTHPLTHTPDHTPTLHPTPSHTSHSTQMNHARFRAVAPRIQLTALGRPGVCEHPLP